MSGERLTIAVFGLGLIATGASGLIPFIGAHWHDPAVRVLSSCTIATYAGEVFVQTDAVGLWLTGAAWLGLGLCVAAAVLPYARKNVSDAENLVEA